MTETRQPALTEYICGWALGLEDAAVPPAVRTAAVRHVLDGYGLALSGHAEESWRILREHLVAAGGVGEAHVLGSHERLPAEAAALVNGLAMHAMDYDD